MSADNTRWRAGFVSGLTPSEEGDPAVYFRRDFDIPTLPVSATLRITALGVIEPYINGVRVGAEVLAPGWTSYRHRLMVSSYNVTELIVDGLNTIGAIVGEGWAVGALTWEQRRHVYADRPALFAQLELQFADHTIVVGSDTEFRIGTGGVRSNGIYSGEQFDARLESLGWAAPGFDDSEWARAQPFDWDLSSLIEPIAPPIRRIEELQPVAILQSPSGKTIVDFGQNISGWVRISVSGDAGSRVSLRHAELLGPDGEIETETNRGAAATDSYTLRGEGAETWEPGFTYHGFRYVEVTGWPGVLNADGMRAIVVHSDMTRTGWFETSNELVNQLHRNVVWSMRGNFVGLPTDCPQRDERLGWTGDINVFSPTATYLYDVKSLLGSWLQDLHAEQIVEGTVPWVVPDAVSTPSSPAAIWSDIAISLPWTLYQEYGDLGILESSYDSMTTFMAEVLPLLGEDGLWASGFQFGDWLDPDAPRDKPWDGKTDAHLIAAAYLSKTTREIAAAAGLLGRVDDAAKYDTLHARVTRAFLNEYVSPSGRVTNESATAYALAIMFDILDEPQKVRAGDRLAEIVERAKFTISTGFAGTHVVTDALSSTGHLDIAYKLLLNEHVPSFLYPVTMGATTMWERWDSVLPDGQVNATGMTSLNHYALGAIADWLHRVVGGLSRAEAGWRRINIAPQPGGGLTSAKTSHLTPRGLAEVEWKISGRDVEMSVLIPEDSTASVRLPLHPARAIVDVESGPHTWNYRLPDEYGKASEFTLETPIKDITADPQVWAAVKTAIRTNVPDAGFDLDVAIDHIGSMTLQSIIDRQGALAPQLRADLLSALDASG